VELPANAATPIMVAVASLRAVVRRCQTLLDHVPRGAPMDVGVVAAVIPGRARHLAHRAWRGSGASSMRIETPQMRTVSPSIRRPHRQAPRDKEGFHVRIDQEAVRVRPLSSITRARWRSVMGCQASIRRRRGRWRAQAGSPRRRTFHHGELCELRSAIITTSIEARVAGIKATAGPYHHRFQTGDVMAENILLWLPLLTEKQRQESEACGVHLFSDRQRAIETMLEADAYSASSMCAGRLDRSVYAIIADKLQGPPYTPPADQSD
jgi:hypothetical protein